VLQARAYVYWIRSAYPIRARGRSSAALEAGHMPAPDQALFQRKIFLPPVGRPHMPSRLLKKEVADLAHRDSLNGGWGWRCAAMTRFVEAVSAT
jgi:hypothetical protein